MAGYLPDQDAYDKLSKIAPTVGVVGGGLVNDWREATLIAGQITDRESEAQAAIDEVDAQIEAVREAHPGLEGATGAFVQISPQGFAVVTEDTDPANEFLSDLGVIVPAEIKEAGQDGGRAFISEENIGIFNTDMLLSCLPAQTPPTPRLERARTGEKRHRFQRRLHHRQRHRHSDRSIRAVGAGAAGTNSAAAG